MQERLKIILDYFYRPKRCAFGFISGKGIVGNADRHKKKKYVVNIDLEDYFGTITFPRVYGIFKNKPFNFSHSASSVLAQLCTSDGKLPQGACTSPVLANIASASLDKQLTQLAKKKGITYTRYADDLTFSFNHNTMEDIIHKVDEFGNIEIGTHLKSIIESNGFIINKNKFRVQLKNERQSVTGLVVNEKVNLEREYIRNTRAMIFGWRKNKSIASLNFLKLNNIDCIDIRRATLIFRNHIYGRLSFIKSVRGKDFPTYLKLMALMSHNDPMKTKEGIRAMKETETYDVFICHASEDKDDIAIPIFNSLEEKGINTFIDHVAIFWGDSLLTKINSALAKSKYVIAILSANSVAKAWPIKELNSVLSREIKDSKIKLLTLMKDGDEEKVFSELPLLEDKLYMVYKNNPDEVADKLSELLKKS
nr:MULTISPECIES: reverse transcriptase domain-containing protein [unclassified Enterobacter]